VMGGVDRQPRASSEGPKPEADSSRASPVWWKVSSTGEPARGGMRDGTRGEHTQIENDYDSDEFAGRPWPVLT
jgi:hypothetical protein